MHLRITSSMMTRQAVARLTANAARLGAAQEQISSGLRFQRASEDPVSAGQVVQTGSGLRALDQYRRTINDGTARLATEESALDGLTRLLERARTLAVGQGSDTANAQTRAAARVEVDNLIQEAVRLGNTRHGDEYLFGGLQADQPPFDLTAPGFSASPPSGARQVEISAGDRMVINHNGTQVFLDSDVLPALQALSDALRDNDRDAIAGSTDRLADAHGVVQGYLGEVGARSNQLRVSAANLEALDVNLRAFKSELQEADMEKAIAELVNRQTVYQAALTATSRILGVNLANYLR